MDKTILKERTREFAHNTVKLSNSLPKTTLGKHVKGQLIRSSTSVAANYRAVCMAQSKAVFIFKVSIVLEEVDECNYWLQLIVDEELLNKKLVEPLINESAQLTSIFVRSRKTAQGR